MSEKTISFWCLSTSTVGLIEMCGQWPALASVFLLCRGLKSNAEHSKHTATSLEARKFSIEHTKNSIRVVTSLISPHYLLNEIPMNMLECNADSWIHHNFALEHLLSIFIFVVPLTSLPLFRFFFECISSGTNKHCMHNPWAYSILLLIWNIRYKHKDHTTVL